MRMLLNIDVPDLDQAEQFYVAAFGLQANRRFGEDARELLGAQAPIYLLRKPAGSVAAGATARDYARHWTPLHLDVVVEDLDASLARALAAGAVQEAATRRTAWGRIAGLADPFGHGWCLVQFSAAGYDAVAT